MRCHRTASIWFYTELVLIVAIVDKVCGPEPATRADRQRQTEHEQLQRTFPHSKWIGSDRSAEALPVHGLPPVEPDRVRVQ